MSAQLIAYLLVAGFLVLAVFQAAIALGAPVGKAAWGGRNPGVLPRNLRVASAVSVLIYLLASLVVLDRAGVPLVDLPAAVSFWGTWALVVLLTLGAIMNFASSSRYERFGWGPFAAVMALLTLLLALFLTENRPEDRDQATAASVTRGMAGSERALASLRRLSAYMR